ncbi:bifunctional DNA primase/polymerase, partial [Catellatospora bangladeshensis]|uniref:bifunctional DNA primase/polymerase n=1 Tax=Catellatospora bangladeshensis TaxID=310355 RepID=UPI0019435096
MLTSTSIDATRCVRCNFDTTERYDGLPQHRQCWDAAALADVPTGPAVDNVHLHGALAWHDAGTTVIPARADGSKRPVHEWKSFTGERPPRSQVEQWFTAHPDWGVGIVCGQVSGNLEMLETEGRASDPASRARIEQECIARGVGERWKSLLNEGYAEMTPSGGIHILYRIADQPVPGNQKIAMSADSKTTYAETRGEGGFVILAPSSGKVHPTGKPWSACDGSQVGQDVRTLTWDERQAIHAAIRAALDERVLPTYERPAGVAEYDRANGDRPGDAFNDDPSITIHEILTRNGWKYLGRKQGQDEYVHPNSSNMSTGSARTGKDGSPNLYAWSGMPLEGSYDKFAVLTHLEYGGDFSACSAALRRLGYGADRQVDDLDDWNTDDDAGQAGATPEAQEGAAASLFVDVAKLLTDGIPPPPAPVLLTRDDGNKLFYAQKVNVLFGDPECGKTWIALAAVVEALNSGGRAAVIDLDHNGAGEIITRLTILGARKTVLGDPQRFLLAEPESGDDLIRVVHALKAWTPTVVVVDSLGELVPMLGLNSSNPDDYTSAHRRTLTVLERSGAAVIAIDHLPKSDEARDRGQTGTMAKKRAINGVSLRVTV